jgi:hypothetical protein
MHVSLMFRAATDDFRTLIGEPNDPNAVLSIVMLLSFTWVLVGLRSYCRSSVTKSFGLDDIFMVVSLVCTQLIQVMALTVM